MVGDQDFSMPLRLQDESMQDSNGSVCLNDSYYSSDDDSIPKASEMTKTGQKRKFTQGPGIQVDDSEVIKTKSLRKDAEDPAISLNYLDPSVVSSLRKVAGSAVDQPKVMTPVDSNEEDEIAQKALMDSFKDCDNISSIQYKPVTLNSGNSSEKTKSTHTSPLRSDVTPCNESSDYVIGLDKHDPGMKRSHENDNIGDIEDVTQNKKARFKRERLFDPIAEHKSWCPWVSLPLNRRGDERHGWQRLLDILMDYKNPEKQKQLQKENSQCDNLKKIRQILNEWTTSLADVAF